MRALICAGLLAFSAASAMPAAAVSYVTDTASFSGLGDTIGSPFDQITLNSVTGDATGPGTYLINTVDFVVGLNSNTGGTYSGTFTNTATIGGSPFTYSVPYTIVISSTDSITLGGNSFDFGGYHVHFNTLTFTDIGSTASGDLTATVSVPEPATWSLMIVGFGLVGFGLRRRAVAPAA